MSQSNFEIELLRRLRELPVEPPSAGFAARALRVRRAPWLRPAMGFALAASLVAGIGFAVWIGQGAAPAESPAAGSQVVVLAPGGTGPVRLAFRSPRDLSGVTISLQLPEGVELAGHPGRQALSWQADFQAGANVLELPLVVRTGASGVLTATLDHGGSHKAFTVQVRADRPAALYPDAPETRSAVSGRYST